MTSYMALARVRSNYKTAMIGSLATLHNMSEHIVSCVKKMFVREGWIA